MSQGLKILVQNMLDFASIVNGNLITHKRKFKVADLLDKIVQLFVVKCSQKKIILGQECDEGLEICTDFNKLCGCLYNFVDNSVKFT